MWGDIDLDGNEVGRKQAAQGSESQRSRQAEYKQTEKDGKKAEEAKTDEHITRNPTLVDAKNKSRGTRGTNQKGKQQIVLLVPGSHSN